MISALMDQGTAAPASDVDELFTGLSKGRLRLGLIYGALESYFMEVN